MSSNALVKRRAEIRQSPVTALERRHANLEGLGLFPGRLALCEFSCQGSEESFDLSLPILQVSHSSTETVQNRHVGCDYRTLDFEQRTVALLETLARDILIFERRRDAGALVAQLLLSVAQGLHSLGLRTQSIAFSAQRVPLAHLFGQPPWPAP